MTTEREIDIFIRNGLAAGPDLRSGAVDEVMRRVSTTPQQRGSLPWIAERLRPFSGATRLVLASAVVALFGGLLLGGLPTTRPNDHSLPAADISPSATAAESEAMTSEPVSPDGVSESTAATTSSLSELLSGSEMHMEQVAPGIYHVLGDGARHDLRLGVVQALADGSVWIGDGRRVFEVGEPSANEFKANAKDPHLAVGPDGRVWLADYHAGVFVLEEGRWLKRGGDRRASAEGRNLSRRPANISDMATHPDGSVWIVAGERSDPLWEFTTVERRGPSEGSKWTSYRLRDHLPPGTCDSPSSPPWTPADYCRYQPIVATTPDGSVWLGYEDGDTSKGALLRFDGETWTTVRPLGGDVDHPVLGLSVSADGTLWAAILDQPGPIRDVDGETPAEGYVLARFDGAEWALYGPTIPVRYYSGEGGGIIKGVGPEGEVWLVGVDVDPSTGRPFRYYPVMFDGQRWSSYPEPEAGCYEKGGCDDIDLAVTPDGTVWASATDYWLAGRGGFYVITSEAAPTVREHSVTE